jgi:hypothetical protein
MTAYVVLVTAADGTQSIIGSREGNPLRRAHLAAKLAAQHDDPNNGITAEAHEIESAQE